jgi:hypothetical protein
MVLVTVLCGLCAGQCLRALHVGLSWNPSRVITPSHSPGKHRRGERSPPHGCELITDRSRNPCLNVFFWKTATQPFCQLDFLAFPQGDPVLRTAIGIVAPSSHKCRPEGVGHSCWLRPWPDTIHRQHSCWSVAEVPGD